VVLLSLVPQQALLVALVLVVPMERARPAAPVAVMPLLEAVEAQMAAVPVKAPVQMVPVEMDSLGQAAALLLPFPVLPLTVAMQRLAAAAAAAGLIPAVLRTRMAVPVLAIRQAQVGRRHQTARRLAVAAAVEAAAIAMHPALDLQAWLVALPEAMAVAVAVEAAAGHLVVR
jgi:hypothetical protein